MKKTRFIIAFILIIHLAVFSQDASLQFKAVDEVLSAEIAMSNPNYLVSAGDVYELAFVLRDKPVSVKLIIDISYNVKILNLATISVNGLTYTQFKKRVEDIIRQNYPLSGVQLIMIKPAVFTVAVKGEVISSGEVRVSSLTRLSSVVKNFFTTYSSSRNIQVISVEGNKKEYDLFQASRNGDFSQNPFLRPGDTVVIQRVERRVTISGSVERPGVYELLENENLKDLIEIYAGGLKEFTDISKITVTRNNKTEDFPVGSFFKIENKESIAPFKLNNNDIVHIPNEMEFKSSIILDAGSGITHIPFTEGADLVSVVRSYRGKFSPLSDTKNAYLMRNGEKVYTNFNRIFYDIDYNELIVLERGDVIVVPVLQQTVIVIGAVLRPGAYPYVPGKTYEYYIALAGGFDLQRNAISSVKIKDVSGKKANKKDYVLPGSIITASSNAFLYNVMPYLSFVATVLTIIGTVFTIVGNLKK
ncbi:SLBB domain-containing protein [Treponema sp. OMZ 788]|uniref:polysaccharide biosynthesis/export family protein n=1 Tax=Treponema sp. OMZ 788 TaxID=2563664 RepID=UPI0020A5AD13|nr:SLBB domain-containing protein [Treponema sp. OMZ 788]UTC64674.1 SLBB domain-containing protein [Treponema sp. OMZ 788]